MTEQNKTDAFEDFKTWASKSGIGTSLTSIEVQTAWSAWQASCEFYYNEADGFTHSGVKMTNNTQELIEEIEKHHRWYLDEKGLTDFGCYDEYKRHSFSQRGLLAKCKTQLQQAQKMREALRLEQEFREICRNFYPEIENYKQYTKVDNLTKQALNQEGV